MFVHLRRPQTSNPEEMRSDPFWEFGSFGCTECHSTNLMSLTRINELDGVRFAFAQGGPNGIRLVKVTPPVTIVRHARCAEVRWTPCRMPFRYGAAPLLIDNQGKSDFPLVRKLVANVNRPTWMGRFASKFRSSRQFLPRDVAAQLVSIFNQRMWKAGASSISQSYEQAMPFPPPRVDSDREHTYGKYLADVREKQSSRNRCIRIATRVSSKALAATKRIC